MSDPKDPDYYARLEKSIFKRKLQPTPDKEAKKPRSSAMPPNDGTPPDFWSQLPRDQQVELKEDLTKHFRLRFEANNAIVQWFRKECLRDPTLEEVTKIRSRAIQRLEPKVREEVLKRKREVATEHQKLKSSLLPPEDRKTPDRDEQYVKQRHKARLALDLAVMAYLKELLGRHPTLQEINEHREEVLLKVDPIVKKQVLRKH
jgi:hypothetical protein